MKEYTIQMGSVSFVVRVIGDVNSPAQPDADSDWNYYGGRETEYDVVKATLYYADNTTSELTHSEINYILQCHEKKLTQLVQYMIDIEDLI